MQQGIKEPKLLLVEGNEDKKFMDVFVEKLKIEHIQIEPYNGKDKLSEILKTLKKRPNYSMLTSIGIIRDADDQKADSVFKILKGYLEKSNFSLPPSLMNFSADTPKTGIFIFPDCESEGELENLLLSAVDGGGAISECLNQFISCCKTAKHHIKKEAKTLFYAWLAAQGSPSLDLWVAGKRSHFDYEHLAFQKLKKFIQNLSSD